MERIMQRAEQFPRRGQLWLYGLWGKELLSEWHHGQDPH
jgi:hypothetical protein